VLLQEHLGRHADLVPPVQAVSLPSRPRPVRGAGRDAGPSMSRKADDVAGSTRAGF
jgi:hypothetical protein